ncbi:tetratricopeptide repeat protein [Candidatus Harpocratesius sp.]
MWEYYDIDKIRQLLSFGRYNEALQNIILYKRKKELTARESIEVELLHIEILLKAGFLQDISPKLEQLRKSSKIDSFPDLKIEWLILEAQFQQQIGYLQKADKALNEAHDITIIHLNQAKNSQIYQKFIQKILFLEGIQHWYEGNINEAAQKLEEVLSLIPHEKGSDQYIQVLTNYGMILCEKGDYKGGIENLKLALELERNLGDDVTLANILGHLGRISHLQGHLDEALNYLQESIFIWENLGDFSQIRFNLVNIGIIYRQKGDYHQALNYIRRSLAIAERIGNPNELSRFLLELLRIYLEMDAVENAEITLARLYNLQLITANKKIELRYRLANALILKYKGRAKDLFQAQNLFSSIVKEPIVEEEISQIALLNLCELFLVELRLRDDHTIYQELDDVIEKLLLQAKDQHSHLLYAETYLLKAKLALLKLNVSEARNFLSQAQIYAENSGLLRIAMKISEEHDKLIAQQQIWNSYQINEVPLQKRVELAEIDNYLQTIVHQKGIDLPQMTNDIPVAFILLNDHGKVLFFRSFTSYWEFDREMLAGFLSAFDTMSGEVFSQTLERAKFGDFNVIINKITPFMLGYVYQGPSFYAQKKIHQISQEFIEHKDILIGFFEDNQDIVPSTASHIRFVDSLCDNILLSEYSSISKSTSFVEN